VRPKGEREDNEREVYMQRRATNYIGSLLAVINKGVTPGKKKEARHIQRTLRTKHRGTQECLGDLVLEFIKIIEEKIWGIVKTGNVKRRI